MTQEETARCPMPPPPTRPSRCALPRPSRVADPTEIGRNYEPMRLVGDAKLTLAARRDAMARQNLTRRGLAGLCWGLPLAIGAQIAAPGSRVVCVVGDGSMLL